MKWLKFLFLFLLLCACQSGNVDEFKIERHPIKEQSGEKFSELTREINQRRIDAVLDNEIESVNVYSWDYVIKVDNETEIEKFRKYFSGNELGENREDKPGDFYLLEVNCVGKDPIYFKMLDNSICTHYMNCNLFGKAEPRLQGEKVELQTDINSNIIYYKTWADEIEIEEVKEEFVDSDVLDIVLYINEWNENSVIQGELATIILNDSYYFSCNDYGCSDSYDQDLELKSLDLDENEYIRFFPISSVELEIKERLVGTHKIIMPSNVQYNDALKAYQRITGNAVGYYGYIGDYLILDEEVSENEEIYQIVKYQVRGIFDSNKNSRYLIYDNVGHYFVADLNQDITSAILENQSLLNRYEVVLEDGKMESMELVHTPEVLPLQPLDVNKEEFYLKDGSGIVNFNTLDATIFNSSGSRYINDELLRYKTNIYDHYLSILVRYDDYITNAYVFDINTGLLVSDDELIADYQMDKDKITQTVYSMYNNCEENYCLSYERYDWWGLENNTIFISSSGQPTVVLNNIDETDVLIMEWEEVQ